MAHILNKLGQREESERRFRESVAIIERVVAENPAVVEHRRVLGTSYVEFGQFLIDRDALAEGLDCLKRAGEHAELVRRSLPDDLSNLVALASVHRGIGKVLLKQGQAASGLESMERAVVIGEAIARRGTVPAYDFACTLALCSEVAAAIPAGARSGGPAAAERYAERSVAELRRAIAEGWKEADWMERDPDLRTLRDRDDFREVIRSLRQATAKESK